MDSHFLPIEPNLAVELQRSIRSPEPCATYLEPMSQQVSWRYVATVRQTWLDLLLGSRITVRVNLSGM